jgi:hypothetical protein
MKTIKITAYGKDGREIDAEIIVCPKCDGDSFFMFNIKSQNHLHIQCTTCSKSYCHDNLCEYRSKRNKEEVNG